MAFLGEKKKVLDTQLTKAIEKLHAPQKLKEAMNYSLSAGGKRLRPILLLSTIEAIGEQESLGMGTAIALEMIHTYSLIHDDLPAMDNDDLRRGRPTNHKVFGEATAILAGDALLTYAFECLIMNSEQLSETLKLNLTSKLARAAGPEGMVGGQQEDLNAEGKELSIDQLKAIHHLKTGRLLTFAIEAGALIGGASTKELNELKRFAEHLGLAFQIRDDILDIEGTEDEIGKPVGSDEANNKSTYPKLLSLQGAKDTLNDHIDQALTILESLNLKSSRLKQLTHYILDRTN
ncbi:polyprenyl synthetase family protein [Terrilactibacillus sp. BCM23-1]|uniref:Farnesyl diphosphate synthase n=1 Tax=Terrilactibacillus tamarindi TaxID=2599694 RepID=A0A6N8CRL9_9BACI|nr:farnesyl diphosphate synthase [Terrilactibacillus tamarindi]MTT32691.1 polyprenyl synthetase family protein [Terrilactibacillus tamarindi]